MVQRAGAHADEHVGGADGGIGHLLIAKPVQPAVLVKRQRFHPTLSLGRSRLSTPCIGRPSRYLGNAKACYQPEPARVAESAACRASPPPSTPSSPPFASGSPPRAPWWP